MGRGGLFFSLFHATLPVVASPAWSLISFDLAGLFARFFRARASIVDQLSRKKIAAWVLLVARTLTRQACLAPRWAIWKPKLKSSVSCVRASNWRSWRTWCPPCTLCTGAVVRFRLGFRGTRLWCDCGSIFAQAWHFECWHRRAWPKSHSPATGMRAEARPCVDHCSWGA